MSAGAQQGYPAKPIRIISPYAPGGTTDVLARLVGSKLTESWGQPIIVEPRPGGNTSGWSSETSLISPMTRSQHDDDRSC